MREYLMNEWSTELDDGTEVSLHDVLIHMYCEGRTEPSETAKYMARAYVREVLGL